MNESLEDEKKAQNGRDIIALWTLYRFNEEQCRYARLAGFDAWLPQHLIDNMPIINARNVHNLNESFRRFAGCVEDLPNRTDDGESSSRCARSSRFPRSSVFGDLVSLDPNTRNVR